MADVEAGKRYAQAAFQIAVASNSVEAWRGELNDVATVLAESGAAPVLADARVPVQQRLAMVERILDVSPLALNLAKLLVSRSRSLDARAVANAFDRMADEAEGIEHAEVTTAVQLSPEQLTSIESQLSRSLGKTVRAIATVDPSIVGGVLVKVGDHLVDGSVRTRLKMLRRELGGAR
jgi:F-type H+-transporting ATPase subunit delta